MEKERPHSRKVRQGVVVSSKMQKSCVVRVERKFRHPKYDKILTSAKKYYAHTEIPDLKKGDVVRIIETRPISKLKRWRVVEVVERAQEKIAIDAQI
jgi:small subunit ribosomal protein S17